MRPWAVSSARRVLGPRPWAVSSARRSLVGRNAASLSKFPTCNRSLELRRKRRGAAKTVACKQSPPCRARGAPLNRVERGARPCRAQRGKLKHSSHTQKITHTAPKERGHGKNSSTKLAVPRALGPCRARDALFWPCRERSEPFGHVQREARPRAVSSARHALGPCRARGSPLGLVEREARPC